MVHYALEELADLDGLDDFVFLVSMTEKLQLTPLVPYIRQPSLDTTSLQTPCPAEFL